NRTSAQAEHSVSRLPRSALRSFLRPIPRPRSTKNVPFISTPERPRSGFVTSTDRCRSFLALIVPFLFLPSVRTFRTPYRDHSPEAWTIADGLRAFRPDLAPHRIVQQPDAGARIFHYSFFENGIPCLPKVVRPPCDRPRGSM